ncbi:MAG: hypothetical protein ACI9HB_000568, partial [Gammaproteobacteria bacterium]
CNSTNTDCGSAGTDCSQASADVCEFAFHVYSPYELEVSGQRLPPDH